jgi:hypothetical protein
MNQTVIQIKQTKDIHTDIWYDTENYKYLQHQMYKHHFSSCTNDTKCGNQMIHLSH